MPGLALHQVRVAAVGKMIARHIVEKEVKEQDVIFAGLFHDMGNIIKADLSLFPEFLEPQGLAYWQEVKQEYHAKYGDDEHAATEHIAREIGLPPSAIRIIGSMGFSKAHIVAGAVPLELKIAEYADQRVSPHGVVSMEERLAEGKKRHAKRRADLRSTQDDIADANVDALRKIEEQIFAQTDISPEHVTDERIAPMAEELYSYPVPVSVR